MWNAVNQDPNWSVLGIVMSLVSELRFRSHNITSLNPTTCLVCVSKNWQDGRRRDPAWNQSDALPFGLAQLPCRRKRESSVTKIPGWFSLQSQVDSVYFLLVPVPSSRIWILQAEQQDVPSAMIQTSL